ncbi:hypothetical protein V6N13_096375 [Hibiscus sabdariffa]|uniref:9-cis-epoxycarotenoid dioxygenase n=1 Tax=Hibiscus sabdariffa TaxID=183260 RepID=A0ABR2DG05_9ROSI
MGHYDPAKGTGHANTSLALFGNRLYALGESDLPYAVRLMPDGDIETLGRHDFDGTLLANMTAHPKVDPESGEAFAFRYGPVRPFLTYFYFDANGNKHPDVHMMSLPHPSFVHDFAITKNYALFADIQMRMKKPVDMIVQGGPPMVSDPAKVARVGVIPRHAKNESEMRWFNVSGFNPMHFVNAWEEDNGNAIVIVAPNVITIQHALERFDLAHSMMEKVRIDLKTGLVRILRCLRATAKDVGSSEARLVQRRVPGMYGGKQDVRARMLWRGAIFVSKEAEKSEDDGYLLSYVHNENTGESRLLVMDAKSAELDIVATVKLPQRVPYGFHGLFVKETELNKL